MGKRDRDPCRRPPPHLHAAGDTAILLPSRIPALLARGFSNLDFLSPQAGKGTGAPAAAGEEECGGPARITLLSTVN